MKTLNKTITREKLLSLCLCTNLTLTDKFCWNNRDNTSEHIRNSIPTEQQIRLLTTFIIPKSHESNSICQYTRRVFQCLYENDTTIQQSQSSDEKITLGTNLRISFLW